jgi:hypothetical protein
VQGTFRDDLPVVSASLMRALGVISAEMSSTLIRFGEVEFAVGVTHVRFPNGGDWAHFACPACNRRARKLFLLEGSPCCCRCCTKRGVSQRSWLMNERQRSEISVPRLRAKLETPPRLKPKADGVRLDRRISTEMALRQALLVLRRHKLRDAEKLRGK